VTLIGAVGQEAAQRILPQYPDCKSANCLARARREISARGAATQPMRSAGATVLENVPT